MTQNNYLVKRHYSVFDKVLYRGIYVDTCKLDFDVNNFVIDNGTTTYKYFGQYNDFVILLDNQICYFKYHFANSNDKVFTTAKGDFILSCDDISVAKRLRCKIFYKI
jgi:hypothetical protein